MKLKLRQNFEISPNLLDFGKFFVCDLQIHSSTMGQKQPLVSCCSIIAFLEILTSQPQNLDSFNNSVKSWLCGKNFSLCVWKKVFYIWLWNGFHSSQMAQLFQHYIQHISCMKSHLQIINRNLIKMSTTNSKKATPYLGQKEGFKKNEKKINGIFHYGSGSTSLP